MILETIVTSQALSGAHHIAPMGVHVIEEGYLIMPFRPSTTLQNLLEARCAVINLTDDVRVFAGCLTGRRDWPLEPADRIAGARLRDTLTHIEVEVVSVEEDDTRPKLLCRALHEVQHRGFHGFNRAQFSVLEAAILVSRLPLLPLEKIERDLAYLRIGVEKTAGPCEWQAWEWLMATVEAYRNKLAQGAASA